MDPGRPEYLWSPFSFGSARFSLVDYALLSCKLVASAMPTRSDHSINLRVLAGIFLLLLSSPIEELGATELAWQSTGKGVRHLPVSQQAQNRVGFTLVPQNLTGILFTNRLSESRSLTNHVLLNGSGVAAGDVDGDGLCDLYYCGLDSDNALYRNLGDWRFQEVTDEAGVRCPGVDATGAVLVDLDGDDDLDLLVNAIGKGTLGFLNDGKGHFTSTHIASGTAALAGSMSMALADIDKDGDLDLYVANYRTSTMRDTFGMKLRIKVVDGRRVVTAVNDRPVTEPDLAGRFSIDENGNILENGEADVLYRNEGGGRFSPLSFTQGVFLDEDGKRLEEAPHDWGLSAIFRDLNQDGAPDLIVCNDLGSTDRFWVNLGDGRFQAIPRLAIRKTSWFSMGVDVGDLNRDGFDDLFITDMLSREHRLRQVQVSDHKMVYWPPGWIENRPRVPRNTLYLNLGDGEYAEMAYFAGLHASDWSWAPVLLDVDLDGYEDVLVVTGFERDVQDIDIANALESARKQKKLTDAEALQMRRRFPKLEQAKLLFRNRGDLTFEEVGRTWGFATPGVTQGIALADLDNDGDLDVVVNTMNGESGLYRNETTAPRVAVRLRGKAPNTRAVGARLTLWGGAAPRQDQEMMAGGRYLSSDDYQRVFAAGSTKGPFKLAVRWPDGTRTEIEGIQPDRVYEIEEATASKLGPAPEVLSPQPLFEDATHLLHHQHQEAGVDDFARQPLLPYRLSHLGPGVSWLDLNQDGWDDLAIGSGAGGRMGVYLNDHAGGFRSTNHALLTQPAARDQTTLIPWTRLPGQTVLLVGTANYEEGLNAGSSVEMLDLPNPRVESLIPGTESSTGPLAIADVDGDGDLDLFVGGRVIPGRYPIAARSRIFRNEAGKLEEDPQVRTLLGKVGLVSGAVFSDLNADGFPDLVLACEWGSPRVFLNRAGKTFEEATESLGLSQLTGWWTGVAAGDLDGDGKMDLILSNWGRNTKWEPQRIRPLRLYYGDFTGAGGTDLLPAYYEPMLGEYVPSLHFGRVTAALPFVQARYTTYREFGSAGVEGILGNKYEQASVAEVVCLETMLFLNRTSRFEAHPLPLLAQLSPCFGVCVCDVDGDGHEDVFLSQNLFMTEAETGRYDAGRGLWLRGDGKGGLTELPARQSGVRVYGEQRGAAVCDYDRDGRVDLVVTQNSAKTRLFHNLGAREGLRVRLEGPAGNPSAIGAQMRLAFSGRMGPQREIHCGSGYWSQDSPIAVLGVPENPEEIRVRWPGGRETVSKIPPAAKEISVNPSGELRALR